MYKPLLSPVFFLIIGVSKKKKVNKKDLVSADILVFLHYKTCIMMQISIEFQKISK